MMVSAPDKSFGVEVLHQKPGARRSQTMFNMEFVEVKRLGTEMEEFRIPFSKQQAKLSQLVPPPRAQSKSFKDSVESSFISTKRAQYNSQDLKIDQEVNQSKPRQMRQQRGAGNVSGQCGIIKSSDRQTQIMFSVNEQCILNKIETRRLSNATQLMLNGQNLSQLPSTPLLPASSVALSAEQEPEESEEEQDEEEGIDNPGSSYKLQSNFDHSIQDSSIKIPYPPRCTHNNATTEINRDEVSVSTRKLKTVRKRPSQ